MAQNGRVYQDAAEKKCFNDVLKQLSLQRTASSSSLGSVDASSVELKRGNSGSLIDFNADTGPSATAAVPMQTFARPPKATNPFDLGGEPTIVHSQSFPSMASLQGALPNAAPSNLVHSSSFGGTPSSRWMPPQSSLYSSAIRPNVYGQQIPSNMQAFGHQGSVGSGVETNAFGGNPLPAASNSFSTVGGNPFG